MGEVIPMFMVIFFPLQEKESEIKIFFVSLSVLFQRIKESLVFVWKSAAG